MRLKRNEIPDEAYTVYFVNDIYIYANYKLHASEHDTDAANKEKRDSYFIIDPHNAFKSKTLADAMVFEKGDMYSMDDQNRSLSRLVNLGTFKFVKNRFTPVGDSQLDVYYYLTPFPKNSLMMELGALTQTDNRTGTRGSLSWKNRNAFKGCEELMFKLNAGIAKHNTAVCRSHLFTILAPPRNYRSHALWCLLQISKTLHARCRVPS